MKHLQREERERASSIQRDHTKSLPGKMRGVAYCKLLQPAEPKVWSFRSPCCGLVLTLVGTAVLLWRRTEALGVDTTIWGSPGMHWEREFPFLGVHIGEVVLPFSGQRASGTIALPHSLSTGTESNRDSGFLLCFTLNSRLPYVGATAFLGQTGTSPSMVRPSLRGPVWVCPKPGL